MRCPQCGAGGHRVWSCREDEEPCCYCGYDGWVPAVPRCCIPDCNSRLPYDGKFPVCRSCGIRIATVYWFDPEMRNAVDGERIRQSAKIRDDRKNGRVPQSRVYYVRLDAERIKIGYSIHLEQRLRSLRVPNSALLAVEPGGRDLETKRHHQFVAERINRNREDFRPTERLMTWIDSIHYTHGLPDWVNKPDTNTITFRDAS